MNYDLILDILTRKTGGHRFIDVEGCPNWQEIIARLLKEYGSFDKEKTSAIYIEKFQINSNITNDDNIRQRMITLSYYYKYLIAFNLVNHLCGCDEIEEAVLATFRFGEQATNTVDLLKKLSNDLVELKSAYETTSMETVYVPKISFLDLDSLTRNIERYSRFKWFCNLYFNALDIDTDNATRLNDYIAARIGGTTCFNIIYDSTKGYPTWVSQNGILIQDPHDYQTITLKNWQ